VVLPALVTPPRIPLGHHFFCKAHALIFELLFVLKVMFIFYLA